MELNVGEWAVLALLVGRPRHGFAVAAELAPGTELGSVWTVRRQLVYRAVDHLVDLGWARLGREEPGVAGPPRRVVAASAIGRRHALAWLDEPVAHLRDVRGELLLKLLLRRRLGRPIEPLVYAQGERFAPVLASLLAADVEPGDVVGRWRRASAEAVSSFLAGLVS
jgi:DNA-binding PadR family transcriptional regulator